MPARPRVILAAALLPFAPALALAYGVAIHNLLPRRSLPGFLGPRATQAPADSLPGVTDADLVAFRRFLYQRGSRLRDSSLRAAFAPAIRRRPPSRSG